MVLYLLHVVSGAQLGFLAPPHPIMTSQLPSGMLVVTDTVDSVCKKLGMTSWIRSKARGFSGGVWMLWDNADVHLDLAYDDYFFLHLLAWSAGGRSWEIMAVYASPNPFVRRFLWDKLDGIRWTVHGL